MQFQSQLQLGNFKKSYFITMALKETNIQENWQLNGAHNFRSVEVIECQMVSKGQNCITQTTN